VATVGRFRGPLTKAESVTETAARTEPWPLIRLQRVRRRYTRTHLSFKTQSSSVEFPNAGSGFVLIGANGMLLL
jgi:hypothetical protein